MKISPLTEISVKIIIESVAMESQIFRQKFCKANVMILTKDISIERMSKTKAHMTHYHRVAPVLERIHAPPSVEQGRVGSFSCCAMFLSHCSGNAIIFLFFSLLRK